MLASEKINDLISEHKDKYAEATKITVQFSESNTKFKLNQNKINTTKYNVITFLPLFLLEQYTKLQNIYVLIIALLNLLPMNRTVSIATSFFPIICVLVISAIRELFEDISRAKQDKQQNDKKYFLELGSNKERKIKAKDIKPGDIIKIKQGQACPVDGILVTNQQIQDLYVSTAAIDGDIDFKKKKSLSINLTQNEQFQSQGMIYAQPQSGIIEQFEGILIEQDKIGDQFQKPIKQYFDLTNSALRGSILQQDSLLIAIYTGNKTKMQIISKTKKVKKQNVLQKQLNKLTLYISILSLLVVLTSILISYFTQNQQQSIEFQNEPKSTKNIILIRFLQSLVVVQYFMPLSLLVSLELSRITQSMMTTFDQKCRKTDKQQIKSIFDKNVIVRDSSVIDNVVQSDIILFDKTGTLTKNQLSFSKTIDKHGKVYQKIPYKYLLSTSICNSSKCDYNIKTNQYDILGINPDDIAITKQCIEQQSIVLDRDSENIQIQLEDSTKIYKTIFEIPYSSEIQFQAILVQQLNNDQQNKYFIFIKGSEQALQTYGINSNNTLDTIQQILTTKQTGARCIYYLTKHLSAEVINTLTYQWRVLNQLDNEKEEKKLFYQQLFKNCHITHCILLKDQIQSSAKSVIYELKRRNIKPFIISGDIALSVKEVAKETDIYQQESDIDYLVQENQEPLINKFTKLYEQRICEQKSKFNGITYNKDKNLLQKILLIDSFSIKQLSENKQMTQQLVNLMVSYNSVITIKMFPDDKMNIAKILKQYKKQLTISAIGDGSNDVSMLKQSDVGIGVVGLEGTQSNQNSDISMPSIEFLPIVLQHSQESGRRNSYLIKYSIYKNSILSFITLIYQLICQQSYTLGLDQLFITLYNSLLTFFIVLCYSITEKDNQNQKNIIQKDLSILWFIKITLYAILQACLIIFIQQLISQDQTNNYIQMENSFICFFIVTIHIVKDIKTFNITILLGIILSLISFIIVLIWENYFSTFCKSGLNMLSLIWSGQSLLKALLLVLLCGLLSFCFNIISNLIQQCKDNKLQKEQQCTQI